MRAALHGSYVDYVIYTGVTERYPPWFRRELDKCTFTDESRFTIWVDKTERRPDYYERQLIEDYSVILRKADGEIHLTDYDVFLNLYVTFSYDGFNNSGIAAFEEDCIEYVECKPGVLDVGYPSWFYEYYTEAINLPNELEGFILIHHAKYVEVKDHFTILRNKIGEIRAMSYESFKKYYDDKPSQTRKTFVSYNRDNNEAYLN